MRVSVFFLQSLYDGSLMSYKYYSSFHILLALLPSPWSMVGSRDILLVYFLASYGGLGDAGTLLFFASIWAAATFFLLLIGLLHVFFFVRLLPLPLPFFLVSYCCGFLVRIFAVARLFCSLFSSQVFFLG